MSAQYSAILKPGSMVDIMGLTRGVSSAIWTSSTIRFNRRSAQMASFQTLPGITTQKAPLPFRVLDVPSQP